MLGYQISDGVLQPNADRVKPILNMPNPSNSKELKQVIGMFSYFAQWLPKVSEKVKPLIKTVKFRIGKEAEDYLKLPKNDLASAALSVIDEQLPLSSKLMHPRMRFLRR